MGLSLRGTTSGAVDINAPAVAGDNTITLPGNNGAANQFYKNSGTAGIVTHSSMIEDSSGNVGIGSIIPQDELDVHGNIITGGLKVVNNDRGNPTRKIVVGSSSVYHIRLYDPNDTTKIQSVFKVDGTVGIGTDNPARKLTVNGGSSAAVAQFTNGTSGVGADDGFQILHFPSGETQLLNRENAALAFYTNNLERLRIDSSGRLFVGGTVATPTTTSADDIVIAGSGNIGLTINSTNSAESSIFFADGTSGSSQYMGQVNYYHSVDALTFASAGSERMRIDSSGRVMIQNTAASSLNAAADDLVVGSGSASGGITVYTGSSDQGALYFADGTNGTEPYVGGINYGHSDNQLRFLSNGSTYMRLDSSGRLLLGTATSPTAGNGQYANIVVQGYPSTPTGAGHISLQRGQAAFGANNQIGLINFGDNTGASYAGIECYADADSGSNDYPGRLVFSTTADSASSPTERMRIDSSGRLLLGHTSAQTNIEAANNVINSYLQTFSSGSQYSGPSILSYSSADYNPVLTIGISNSNTKGTNTLVGANWDLGMINFVGNDGNSFETAVLMSGFVDGTAANGSMPGGWRVSTSPSGSVVPAERMRINSLGKLGVMAEANSDAMAISSGQGSGTSYEYMRGMYGSTTAYAGTLSYRVFTNGNVQNTNNSYGAISDIKLKENIVDASSQWADIKGLRVRNYNFKEGQTHTQLGLVAQEVETVSPGLVTESPDRDEEGTDLGTVTKSVNYSVLYMKAVKALQESMTRIEQLETQNADLLARVTALEG